MTMRKSKQADVDTLTQRKLTDKQMTFCKWYVSSSVKMNATEAARRAGYVGNENTLGSVGFQNMQKPAIREEIDRRLRLALMATEVTIEKVLRDIEITRLAAMEAGQFGTAVRCCELQGKYLKMFSDRIEHVQSIEKVSTAKLVQLIQEIAESGDMSILEMLTAATKKASIQ